LSNTATLSYSWGIKGEQPIVDCKQRNRERLTTFGSLNICSGQITINFAQRGNYQSFKIHLKKLLRTYKNAGKIILIVDNVRYHHAKLLKKFIQSNPKLEIMYLPPYSPNLNPIERVWWFMRKSITHNRYLVSLQERKKKFLQMFSHFTKPNQKLLSVCNVNY
jgi:transposase